VPKDNLIEIRNYARQGILLKSEVERLKNIEKKYIKTAESLEEYKFKCEKLQNAFNNMHKVLEFSKEISPQVEEKINKFVKNKEFHTWKNKEEREKEQMNQSKNRSKGFER
jgi:membrane-associated HD superfamily phosphohydrolase